MRAAIYCRISRDKTGEEAGVTRQLEDCRSLAKDLNWIVVEEFIDNDISAVTGRVRPAYKRLLAAIQAGEVDALVIWHPDRLYRRMVDLIDILAVVQPANTQVATVKAGKIDLTTPAGQMLAEILASVAQYEGRAKADRWLRSVRQRREKGQAPGWGPRLFGYRDDGTLEPEEAEVARWAIGQLIEGESMRSVVKQMNSRGVRTTLGNPWSPQSLKVYVTNPRIAGHSTLGRSVPTGEKRPNGEPIKRRVVDMIAVGQWEPLVSDETFQQVVAVAEVRRGTAPTAPRVSLLVGVLACGECGTMLTSGRLSKRKGEAVGRRVYRCPRPPRADGCGKVAGMAEPVEEIVEAFARARLSDPKVREAVTRLAASSGASAAEVVELEDRLAELEAQLDAPGVPVAAIIRAMDRTREHIETLRASAVTPTRLPRVGEWPPDLRRRRALVDLALAGHTLHLDPAPRRGANRFNPERVRIELA